MKTSIYTFDYELFLGGYPVTSGSIESSLITPTFNILNIFSKYKIEKAIFFVDTMFIYRLTEISKENDLAKRDLERIYKQLNNIINNGHYIFPHIHPHWLDAKYLPDINQWDLTNLSKYRFTSLTKQEREFVFQESFKIINFIYNFEKQDFIGYRAGGWCIEPFSDFKDYFYKYNIQYDFSVLKGVISNTNAWNYNFKSSPKSPIYKFGSYVLIEDKNGSFTEFQISSFKYNIIFNPIIRILDGLYGLIHNENGMKDVYPIINDKKEFSILKKIYNNALKVFTNKYQPLSFEGLSPINKRYYTSYIRKHDFIQFISHPKLITKNNLFIFEELIKENKLYSINTDFKALIK